MYIGVYYLLMKLNDLRTKINTSIFSQNDVVKLFPNESTGHINTQLYRMVKRGDLIGIKRGLYCFSNSKIDEFVVAGRLYAPSYVSLESALNVYGIIPDIPANVTSVAVVTSKKLNTSLGTFLYSKINKDLFFGFKSVLDETSGLYYKIALPEKALLDYIYIRRVKDLSLARVDVSSFSMKKVLIFLAHFPKWVRVAYASASS